MQAIGRRFDPDILHHNPLAHRLKCATFCSHSLAVRMLAFHAGGRGSIPRGSTTFDDIAQLVERAIVNRGVVGSSPSVVATLRGIAQSGSASALGAEGCRFKSCYPDHFENTKALQYGRDHRTKQVRSSLLSGWGLYIIYYGLPSLCQFRVRTPMFSIFKQRQMIIFSFILTAMAFDQPTPHECVIDRCEDELCVVDTPEGYVQIPKKRHYKEGTPVVCPLWLIDPT